MPNSLQKTLFLFGFTFLLFGCYLNAQNQDLQLKFAFGEKVKEGRVHNFGVLYERPTKTDKTGYFPRQFIHPDTKQRIDLETTYEDSVTFRWQFGSGGEFLSSGERPVAQHVFKKPGEQVVTVSMYAGEKNVKTISKTFIVENTPLRIRRLTSIQTNETEGELEFSAIVGNALEEDLIYEWDFGDGETLKSEHPHIKHKYLLTGTYPVTLKVIDVATDDEASKTIDVEFYGSEKETVLSPESNDGQTIPEEVAMTYFEAVLSGSINDTMRAEIRPFAGIFLAPQKEGCRFMFNAWDRENLLMMTIITDIGYFSPEAHQFVLSPVTAQLVAFRNSDYFLESYQNRGNRILPKNASIDREGQATIHRGSHEQAFANRLIPASSPYALQEEVSVTYLSGNIKLDIKEGERISASLDLDLGGEEEFISITGSFALNLQSAIREGIIIYDCGEPSPFEIKEIKPKGDIKLSNRDPIEVKFTESYNPKTLKKENILVAYPASDGEGTFIPVGGRIVKDKKRFFFVPDKPWRSGVRYTIRIKAGQDGLKSYQGISLQNEVVNGWYERDVWAELDFTLANGGNLGAHVFQSVRDAPLIKGKPLMHRIYASWAKHEDVASYAQTETYTAQIVGEFVDDSIKTTHTFVRPDLWKERGMNKANADHTANLYGFVPQLDSRFLLYSFRIESFENGRWVARHRVKCPGRFWDYAPVLKIDWYLAPIGDFSNKGYENFIYYADSTVKEAAHRLWQQFPFRKILLEYRDSVPIRMNLEEGVQCDQLDQLCVIKNLAFPSETNNLNGDPDLIVCFFPEGTGGGTSMQIKTLAGESRLINEVKYKDLSKTAIKAGILNFPLSEDKILAQWNISGIVHEAGHAFYLKHKPALNFVSNGPAVEKVRQYRKNRATFSHEGIEGFALRKDGKSGFNKSSTEGNGEGTSLTVLMHPLTLKPSEMFISADNYRSLMKVIENSGSWDSLK